MAYGTYHTVDLKSNGTVVAIGSGGYFDQGQCDIEEWRDIVSISVGSVISVGLHSNGIAVVTGRFAYAK